MSNRNCNCCERILPSTALTLANGVLMIDVNFNVVPSGFKTCHCYCIKINNAIPAGSECARITIKPVGGTAIDVLCKNGNYYRACHLDCHTVLKLVYFSDPSHFMFSCRGKSSCCQ